MMMTLRPPELRMTTARTASISWAVSYLIISIFKYFAALYQLPRLTVKSSLWRQFSYFYLANEETKVARTLKTHPKSHS